MLNNLTKDQVLSNILGKGEPSEVEMVFEKITGIKWELNEIDRIYYAYCTVMGVMKALGFCTGKAWKL